jgi:hypothetical protein
MNKKQYIVTLKEIEDKKEFREEMENSISVSSSIPKEPCICVSKRSISRNIHYLLDEEQAQNLLEDERVLCVQELDPNIKPVPMGFKSCYKKYKEIETDFKYEEEEIKSQNIGDKFAYTNYEKQGENVDVVIVDGHINPEHPEFSKRIDGSGGTRVNQINWFQYDGGFGNYSYLPYTSVTNTELTENNNHGMHVAGILAGSIQGWAKKSNIYNINPYVNQFWRIFDYVRDWHNTKPINPTTGHKNPTIVNNSWGFERTNIFYTNISAVFYRGVLNTAPAGGFSIRNLISWGIMIYTNGFLTNVPFFNGSVDADIEDMIKDGIIVVCASGNNSLKIDESQGVDYDNYFLVSGSNVRYYYHRGGTPGSTKDVISVGSMDINYYKSNFSNCGPNVTLYAGGSSIVSSVHVSNSGVADQRNPNFYFDKYSGTSMSSPQVAGIIAAAAENSNMNQQEAINFLADNWKVGEIIEVEGGGHSNLKSLQDGPNRKVFYPYSSYEIIDFYFGEV